MSETAYNGWEGKGNRASAYATWRVCLEMFDGYDFVDTFDEKPERVDFADYLKEQVQETVRGEDYDEQNIATQYAMSFLDDVNWDEIAEHFLSDWED